MPDASDLQSQVVTLLKSRGYERREEPFQLASGAWSHDYVDCRRALAHGDGLELASRAVAAHLSARHVHFDAVGGLTMGADPLAHGIAMVTGTAWFSVRKEAKEHGKGKLIEGIALEAGMRVVLVEDVVTSGGSMLRALEAVEATGAEVVAAVPLLDRGEAATVRFAERKVPFAPVATYRDLGIEPVGG